MLCIYLLLGNLFDDLKFLQGQIMFQLSIEDLHQMQMDVSIEWVVMEKIIVFNCIGFD
jgi:hypothetical protein